MTVKSKFTQEDFVSILSRYNLGLCQHFEPIKSGTVQTNYIIQTTQGKYVYRCYETREMPSVLFESELITYLAENNYPCPRQLKNKLGTYIGTHHDKPYAIFEFINGHHIETPSAHHWKQIIRKAAELQNLTQNFCSEYTKYRWNYTPDLCRSLAQKEAARINTKSAHEKYIWLMDEATKLDLPPVLPKGICHCDFHFSNILFQDNKFAALIDFDDANYTFLQFDLVGLIEYCAWPHNTHMIDFGRAREVVSRYMKFRSLSPLEQRHLFDVYKLSILFDCVWYFARGIAGDFREKQKIDALSELGRSAFCSALFE